MSYKYTIVQENVNDKTKTTFEFSANDEDDFVDNITSFMNMVGWIEGGNLEVVYEDDYDSEVILSLYITELSMRRFYSLEFKTMDSKGREKNAQFVGIFKSVEEIEKAKSKLLRETDNNISFQVYNHEHVF